MEQDYVCRTILQCKPHKLYFNAKVAGGDFKITPESSLGKKVVFFQASPPVHHIITALCFTKKKKKKPVSNSSF